MHVLPLIDQGGDGGREAGDIRIDAGAVPVLEGLDGRRLLHPMPGQDDALAAFSMALAR